MESPSVVANEAAGIRQSYSSVAKESGEEEERRDTVNLMVELATLQAGESFGELSIISDDVRAASAITKEESHFAVLNRNDYEKVLLSNEHKSLEHKISTLKSMPMFHQLGRKMLRHLSYFFKE